MKKKDRIPTQLIQNSSLNNHFDALDTSDMQLNPAPPPPPKNSLCSSVTQSKKGRINLRREKSGRGGKTVTVLEGIDNPEDRKALLKTLQKQCACGGTIRENAIEIQGDKRNEMATFLKDQGYRVVLSGG